MKQGYVVIGGNYGDEGKGLMTDYLANLYDAKLVARFNGGTQAGHTVCTPDGKRHVFGHLGAGTFLGADTYLSRDFIVNPYLFPRELSKFRGRNGIQFRVTAHPKARVTTIYDMLINAGIERSRGIERHGSCGLGINETVTRSLSGFGMEVGEVKMSSRSVIADMLELIHRDWVPKRLQELGLQNIATAFNTNSGSILLSSDYETHAEAIMRGLEELNAVEDPHVLGPVIFEGAQGLALDEFFGEFPHVTRSITGLHNAVVAARDLGVERLRPIYVTRSYSTRHGAGPLKYEGETFTQEAIEDSTNVHNEWQGTIRYAPLDLGQLRHLIKLDMLRGQSIADELGIIVERPQLAVTWVDKIEDGVTMYDPEGIQHTVSRKDLAEFLTWKLDVDVKFMSLGSTRDTVTQVD